MAEACHEDVMRRAIACAYRGWGLTHPNPAVGAVISENGRVVAEGYHARAGDPHAEIMALRALGRKPSAGAILYVTLEPCSTQGRTAPCTQAILSAGIRHVVVGTVDPNPAHAGRGLDLLRGQGVRVEDGVLSKECADINLLFNYAMTHQRVLLAGKSGVSLDAKVSTRTGHSRWITGPQSRENAHRWRAYFPAIAVGSGTVLADNPSLTIRLPDQNVACAQKRFVFDRRLRCVDMPLAQVFTDAFRERTVLVSDTSASAEAVRRCEDLGICLWQLSAEHFFDDFRERCAHAGLGGVYCEGGPGLLSALLAQRQLDYLFVYRAPLLLADAQAPGFIGGLAPQRPNDGCRLYDLRREVLGEDDLVRGFLKYAD